MLPVSSDSVPTSTTLRSSVFPVVVTCPVLRFTISLRQPMVSPRFSPSNNVVEILQGYLVAE